jgi:transcriptional regulator with XRE-family HTH domain
MPLEIPDWAWQRTEVVSALERCDISALLQAAQKYSGASQTRIASEIGLGQGRVSEIIKGRRQVVRFDVIERIAAGLDMPDFARRLLGLAAAPGAASGTTEISRAYSAQHEAVADIQLHAAYAEAIDVLAVRGLGLLALNSSVLRRCLLREEQPPQLRVLLLHPRCEAVHRRAEEIGESAASLSNGIQLAESRLRELGGSIRVNLWYYREPPTWRIVRLDATLYVSVFTETWEGHESGIYRLASTERGPLYHGFRRMFEVMLRGSERVL